MISVALVIAVMFVHFVGDFVCQRHKWAMNKSKSNIALGKHVLTYTAVLAAMGWALAGWLGLLWAVVNGVLHFMIDHRTSRMTSRLFGEGRVHDFFVVVGLDQWLHHSILILSAWWWL